MGIDILSGNGVPYDISGIHRRLDSAAVFMRSAGAALSENGYAAGVASQALPMPGSYEIGDLLCVMVASSGSSHLNADSNGNFVLGKTPGGAYYYIYYKYAVGSSSSPSASDAFQAPAQSAGTSMSVRFIQMIAVATADSAKTPTWITTTESKMGEKTSGGNLQIAARVVPADSWNNTDIFTLVSYRGHRETGGGLGATPYEFTEAPANTTEIGQALDCGFLQPNPKYWLNGWSRTYLATVTTTLAAEIDKLPTGAYTYQSAWWGIYAA